MAIHWFGGNSPLGLGFLVYSFGCSEAQDLQVRSNAALPLISEPPSQRAGERGRNSYIRFFCDTSGLPSFLGFGD